MDFTIELDCKLEDQEALFRHQNAFLVATMLNNTYVASKEALIGTGPELYAEQWITNFTPRADSDFKDLILIYFVKILIGIQDD